MDKDIRTTRDEKKDDEIDLGQLFRSISRAFSNFFAFIIKILKEIFHLFIITILFFRKHFLKISAALIIGAVIGFVYDYFTPPVYYSSMVVEPNFNSTRQLHKDINYYNELVKQRDTLLLKRIFNKLSMDEITSIISFEIEPVKNKVQDFRDFSDFRKEMDTAITKLMTIEEYNDNLTGYDYRFYTISIRAHKNGLFKTMEDDLITPIESNAYLNLQKSVYLENLNRSDSILNASISHVDELRKIYNKVLLEEAKRKSEMQGGTTINMENSERSIKEISLFNLYLKMDSDRKKILEEKVKRENILNIISDFSERGTREVKINTIIFGLIAALIMIFFIIIGDINRLLDKYQRP